jgi:hypothetical protein
MIIKSILNPTTILNRFGKAWLIKKANGERELVGGSVSDFTEAREWVSMFAHDVVFSRLFRTSSDRPNRTKTGRN